MATRGRHKWKFSRYPVPIRTQNFFCLDLVPIGTQFFSGWYSVPFAKSFRYLVPSGTHLLKFPRYPVPSGTQLPKFARYPGTQESKLVWVIFQKIFYRFQNVTNVKNRFYIIFQMTSKFIIKKEFLAKSLLRIFKKNSENSYLWSSGKIRLLKIASFINTLWLRLHPVFPHAWL